jgi:hypothetical protein
VNVVYGYGTLAIMIMVIADKLVVEGGSLELGGVDRYL